MPFATGPVLTYIGLGCYRTVGPTVYVSRDQLITIPSDFATDLASVPRLFWALMPPTGSYERAAVAHDFLCEALAGRQPMPDPPITSREVDGLFRRIAKECGVGAVTRQLLWLGVRLGALGNRHRRPGIVRDLPRMAAVAVPALAVLAAVLLGLGWLLALVSPLY